MDIKQYLAEEGIEGRLGLDGFEKLKTASGASEAIERNEADFDRDPVTAMQEHYGLLAKCGVLNQLHGLLFEEILVHAPEIATKIKPYARVLDAGCGDGLRLAYYAQICSDSHFMGIDYSLESVALAEQRMQKRQRKNVAVRVLDIADVEKLNEQFDCVTATNVLHERCVFSYGFYGGEWKQDIVSGLALLSSVLKSGGRFVFTLHFGDESSKEYIVNTEIKHGLVRAGLEVEEQTDLVFNHFDNKTINGLWVCRKKTFAVR